MEATGKITGKKVVKVLGAAGLATGVVVLSAVIASGAAVGTIMEGFKSAKNTIQTILKEDKAVAADEVLVGSIDRTETTDGEL